MSVNPNLPPRVVILGAGYAGALVARSLEEDAKLGRILVTVVERREAVHHKIGAIRACVRAGEWTERVRIPLSRVIKHGRIVIGNVMKVDEENKTLIFEDSKVKPLPFDILIAATGTINHSPGDLPAHLTTKDEVRAYFRENAKAIADAKNIIIVGGGASAVEYAGEIRDAYPEKEITILCSSAHLLTSSIAPLSPQFLKTLYEALESKNIKLIRGEKVIKPADVDFGLRKFAKGPLTVNTIGEQNLELTTDLLLWAATWSINTSIYPDTWLNELGELNISSTFQLVERKDVFAFGDVSSLAETKQAITLPPKMKLIRHNICKVAELMRKKGIEHFDLHLKTKGTKDYRVTDKVTMYLPVGQTQGVSQVGKKVYGAEKTSKFKGVDLYTDLFWKQLTGGYAPMIVGKDD